jgi:hypothetical protein
MSEILSVVQDIFKGYTTTDPLLIQILEIIKLSTASILLIMTFRYILNIVMLLITKFVGVAK